MTKFTEEHKKQLCELAGVWYEFTIFWLVTIIRKYISLKILVKAMWAINRERNFYIYNYGDNYTVNKGSEQLCNFCFHSYNYSETEALKAALKYVLENKENNK